MTIIHTRIQHGVGQGSFHSASVVVHQVGQRYRFDYVYDCGAGGNPPSKALGRCIKRLGLESRVGEAAPKGYLDLLVLSHFDQDHINGAKQLVKKCKVGRIVLPYVGVAELEILIASQVLVDTETFRALHRLANGEETLWGVPVTMVKAGSREYQNPDEPNPGLLQNNELEIVFDTPHKMTIVAAGSGKELEQEHEDGTDIHIGSMAGSAKWKLRFWNRGLDKKLLEAVENRLKIIDFPFDMVDNKTLIDSLLDWIRNNKKKLHGAYSNAIKHCYPDWSVSKDKLPNFISIGMYSGPNFHAKDVKVRYRQLGTGLAAPEYYSWLRGFWGCKLSAGWLGTGDAPLGESGCWDDFSKHYKNDLPRTSTVLIPHHGAGPTSGPRSFNPGLIYKPGVVAVISFGTNNIYGHPKTSVLEEIFAKDGEIQCVTENTVPGFCESFAFDWKCF